MSMLDQLQIETLEVLAGRRNPGERDKAAVRIADLEALTDYSYRLKSSTVAAAPTAVQHNALVEDVQRLHQILQSLSTALKDRLGRA